MLIWIVISFILAFSFAFLLWYLKYFDSSVSKSKFASFSTIRAQEIKEELVAGRLTEDESQQLQQDLQREVAIAANSANYSDRFFASGDLFTYKIFTVFIAVTLLGSLALYQYLGFNTEVQFTDKVRKGKVTPENMTEFLTYRANKYDRAEDWYWLGKDNVGLQDYQAAQQNFEKALAAEVLNDQDLVAILVEYAQSIFFANGQKANAKLEQVIERILAINPKQTTALGLKGIVAFDKQDYKSAVIHWQNAILAGADLAERESLLKGISSARNIGHVSETEVPSLITHKISVKLTLHGGENLPSDAVFLVYAKSPLQPMPVAIKRILPAQLNQIIELTNIDNLMPGLSLSNVSNVDVVVKLAHLSDQDLTQGKQVAYSGEVKVNSNKIVRLSIEL